jgi:hypothetical protein
VRRCPLRTATPFCVEQHRHICCMKSLDVECREGRAAEACVWQLIRTSRPRRPGRGSLMRASYACTVREWSRDLQGPFFYDAEDQSNCRRP